MLAPNQSTGKKGRGQRKAGVPFFGLGVLDNDSLFPQGKTASFENASLNLLCRPFFLDASGLASGRNSVSGESEATGGQVF